MISPANGASEAIVDGIDIDAVHDAVAGCPGVAGLGSGHLGEMATYLPGRRVPGVRVSSEVVELEIRTTWGAPAKRVFADIRTALAGVVTDRRVDLTLADIELPEGAAEIAQTPAQVEARRTAELTAPSQPAALPPAPTPAPLPAPHNSPESETT